MIPRETRFLCQKTGFFCFLLFCLLLGCVLPQVEVTFPGDETPTPAPAPIELTRDASGLVLLQHRRYDDEQGQIHVVGLVANQGQVPRHLIHVYARFLDADGLAVAEQNTYTYGGALAVGDRAPFDLTYRDPPDTIHSYTLWVEGKETETPPLKDLEIVQFNTLQPRDQTQIVIGELVSRSERHLIPHVLGMATNTQGELVDVGYTYPHPDPLRPGETVPFKLIMDGVYEPVAHYELWASAKAATQDDVEQRAPLEVVSTHRYRDRWNTVHVVGLVRNTGPTHVKTVRAIAAFYDTSGFLRAVETGYAWHSIVRPGETSPFGMTLYRNWEGIDHWSFWPAGYRTEDVPPEGLVVEAITIEHHDDGQTSVRGQVVNQGTVPLTGVRVVAVGSDDGEIRTFGRTSIDGTFGPQAAAPFEIQLPTEEATTFEVDVQGKVPE